MCPQNVDISRNSGCHIVQNHFLKVESNTDSDFEEDDTDGMENSRVYENIEKCSLHEDGPLYENMEALTLENPSLRRRPTRRSCSSSAPSAPN